MRNQAFFIRAIVVPIFAFALVLLPTRRLKLDVVEGTHIVRRNAAYTRFDLVGLLGFVILLDRFVVLLWRGLLHSLPLLIAKRIVEWIALAFLRRRQQTRHGRRVVFAKSA